MEIYQKLAEAIDNKEGISLVTIIDVQSKDPKEKEYVGNKILVWENGEVYSQFPLFHEMEEEMLDKVGQAYSKRKSQTYITTKHDRTIEYYLEVFPPPVRLIIAGAGHVARPVAEVSKLVGFSVTVVDDREEYAKKEFFPKAEEVVCAPFIDYFRNLKTDDSTYILLITRGHNHDVSILPELFDKKAAYIGMIGSRRRISGVFSQLKREYPEQTFENIYAPIGLDIGAQTPEEIAVSIVGEVLAVKNQASGMSLRKKVPFFIQEEGDRDA